jgi:Cdc6-like AAA superfamily ATPase
MTESSWKFDPIKVEKGAKIVSETIQSSSETIGENVVKASSIFGQGFTSASAILAGGLVICSLGGAALYYWLSKQKTIESRIIESLEKNANSLSAQHDLPLYTKSAEDNAGLDNKLANLKKNLLIYGTPGAGKTSYIRNWAANVNKGKEGRKVIYCALGEKSYGPSYALKQLHKLFGIQRDEDINHINNAVEKMIAKEKRLIAVIDDAQRLYDGNQDYNFFWSLTTISGFNLILVFSQQSEALALTDRKLIYLKSRFKEKF